MLRAVETSFANQAWEAVGGVEEVAIGCCRAQLRAVNPVLRRRLLVGSRRSAFGCAPKVFCAIFGEP
jgi:hypothetical protein